MDIGGGALLEEIDHQMRLVGENLLDPNTSYKDARKLKIEIVFKQDETRQMVDVVSKVSAQLAASKPFSAQLAFGIDQEGAVQAVEILHNPGQLDIFGNVSPSGKMIKLEKVKEVSHD
jgi:hypothetical protein